MTTSSNSIAAQSALKVKINNRYHCYVPGVWNIGLSMVVELF